MRITKEHRDSVDKTYVTVELSLGDALMLVGVFFIVVIAAGFGLLRP